MNYSNGVESTDIQSFHIIKNKYEFIERIGQGHFGTVFKGRKIKTGELIAIKMEPEHSGVKSIKHEARILNYLNQRKSKYVPTVHWYGSWSDHTCLIIPLYDCTLADLIQRKPVTLNPEEIMRSMIYILENIHASFLVHRDIKPENFMVRESQLFLIDFGMATFYIDETGEHLKPGTPQTTITGSPKYVSIHVHNGLRPSRRDDLISIGHIGYFILCGGRLPWENIVMDSDMQYNDAQNIDKTDIRHPVNVMCKRMKERELEKGTEYGKNNKTAGLLQRYMKYLYRVEYEGTPNYEGLIELWESSLL
jgi:serine/threonine protein kinase